ncbi:MAG: 1-acyl-sn-glycerol-3-phosphate acyltransferase, partial [Selenomonadaceae bacterium]|nr:1-acyl-sn-glycerol-3-phosphate acyltransferase [Selenomonadaceae bacterium]
MLYVILKIIFQLYFRILFRAEIRGTEQVPKEGALILAANHMSNWDPPFLACFCPRIVSYMAKQELFEHPVFGAAIRCCHAFPIKRGAGDREPVFGIAENADRIRARKADHLRVACIARRRQQHVVAGTAETGNRGGQQRLCTCGEQDFAFGPSR